MIQADNRTVMFSYDQDKKTVKTINSVYKIAFYKLII